MVTWTYKDMVDLLGFSKIKLIKTKLIASDSVQLPDLVVFIQSPLCKG